MPGAVPRESPDLEPPPTKGRFRPNRFNDGWLWSKKYPHSASLALTHSTPETVVEAVSSELRHQGFEVVQDEAAKRHAQLFSQHPATVRGMLVGERGLRLDRGLSRRLDWSRWASLAASLPLIGVGMSNLLLGTPHVAIPLAATFGLLAVGGCLFAYAITSFTNMDFWSDLVVVQYSGPFGSGSKTADLAGHVSDLTITISVGRARTENWQSKVEKGRSVKVILDDPRLHSVASSLRDRLSSERTLS
jgi:hypothetical protein